MLALFQQNAQLQLPGPRAKGRLHRADKGQGLNRALKKSDVVQGVDQPLPPRFDAGLLLAAGQQDEREIRPGRLLRNPFEQQRRIFSKQGFFGDKCGGSPGLKGFHKAWKIAAGLRRDPAPAEQIDRGGSISADRSKDNDWT